MPRFGEIFSEGTEHVRRSWRKFSFEQQLKTAKRMEKRALQTIGETAWRLRLQEGADCDAWKELEQIESEIALVHEETAKRTDELREQMTTERRKHLELQSSGGIADVDLEELAAKRISLLEEINKEERALKKAGEDESRQKEHEASLDSARKILDELDEQIEAIQNTINHTAANQQKLLQHAESLEKQERAAHSEMDKREKDLKKTAIPHYRALARHLLDNRPDHKELVPLFARYDLVTATAETTRLNIESERRLIELLDHESVVWFYGLGIGGIFAVVAILVLLVLWIIPALW